MSPTVPVELQLRIFELSIEESKKMGPTFMCLSSYVHAAISPVLYDTLAVSMSSRPSKEAIKTYDHHIRNLFMCGGLEFDDDDAEWLHHYLRSCINLVNFGIWTDLDIGTSKEAHDLLKKLPLVRLSIDLGMRDWDKYIERRDAAQKLRSSFSQVTHLELLDPLGPYFFPCLAALPKLRYLSMSSNPVIFKTGLDLRKDCPDLKVIVLIDEDLELGAYKELERHERGMGVEDPRVIDCLVPRYGTEWERGARGEPDYFDFALKRLEEKMYKIGRCD